ncbi:toxin-antitoxin system HicB family antitoxin [Gulosibacter sp. 10]|uniref:toxin-antitoxin system HicB family antitoxin n=1 Tax=Gulosibacter sp. 10 TaxID=1255570 RepID=UPI00097EE06A|nr:toxin-antitoxin system HicB family antitoxin [Gulosibacter sp. 10]SJM64655.1 hypothetical protein FM112_10400 [Gulosibacter sp. 10]
MQHSNYAAWQSTSPEAIAEHHYSGKFVLRVTPEAHRGLALDAAEQQVSPNRPIAARLGSPRPDPLASRHRRFRAVTSPQAR